MLPIANFILPVSEVPLSDHTSLNFHQLAIIVSFSTGSAAIALSLFLIWMHALHYTKPAEQKKSVQVVPSASSVLAWLSSPY